MVNIENNKIDVVYTWVNNQDPDWIEMYTDTLSNLENNIFFHKSVNDEGRYRFRNELYYSIISVVKYAPWVNRIYVVTNCAIPQEILSIDPRIIHIPHEVIFTESKNLPTFNSHAIECNIHRIPDLAEHFIYFNDDVFLCKPSKKSDFFPKNQHINIFPSKHIIPYNSTRNVKPVDSASVNAGNILFRDFNYKPTHKLHHAPFPILKSVMEELQQRYSYESRETSNNKFRNINDIPFATTLHAYYCAAKNIGHFVDAKSRYIDISHPLFFLLTNRFSSLRKGKYQFFCLNEVTGAKYLSSLRDRYIRHVLECIFL